MEKEDGTEKSTELGLGNPLYCSYIEGLYTYKDPLTLNEYTWDEEKKLWLPKSVEIYFDGSHYLYDDKDGQVMYWEKEKMTWIPKAVRDDTGYSNPNYDSSSQQPRRFYYASLSPTNMGVNSEPVFLSPDDQVNNNNVVEEEMEELPLGWERHEDSTGAYYWHIKSGTIQREIPKPSLLIPGKSLDSQFIRRSTSTHSELSSHLAQSSNKAEKRKSWSEFIQESKGDNNPALASLSCGVGGTQTTIPEVPSELSCLKFGGVSLGCLSISEEDLTPERSSRAVSRVISELTSGTKVNAGLEVAGKIWGGGSELYLELDESNLRVKTTQNLIVAEQPIHSIRVWGVGRDDPRDFAYVAREKSTRQFLCHVFRLEMNARPLASALRDACKKIMIERQKKMKRPTSLPMKKQSVNLINFPTPMDEPRKLIKAYYLGGKLVNKPTGMDVLNAAIDSMKNSHPMAVTVSVAPSVLEIKSDSGDVCVEIRVRYLSFMGIGRDVTTCGLIVHTARDEFEAHCFYSTPSSGALCKAIEAACVLRYQKCLDAHHHHGEGEVKSPKSPNCSNKTSSLASTFKSVLGRFASIDKS
ncbi:unnamed protein product [Allacma fusca]|uniref:Uncharacterized protein n=1 Tax=Allacma fusca TaxID=39272 RepID=A0A8J2PM33_9HEXA|nr:unnamed protein product [Allacma fusca]